MAQGRPFLPAGPTSRGRRSGLVLFHSPDVARSLRCMPRSEPTYVLSWDQGARTALAPQKATNEMIN